jgi:hypothetical protein
VCRAEPFSGYACDTWAAGVLLWVFIYGTLPFMEETPDDLFEAITTKDLEFPADKVRYARTHASHPIAAGIQASY